jgi:arylsulfatase A-like enzyme
MRKRRLPLISRSMAKFFFTLIVFFCLFQASCPAQDKPNILWITFEDTSPQFIGCYGNPSARTPVMDQLAKDGIRFTNAFSTGTVCSPSRTALITGVKTYKAGNGHHRSDFPLPEIIRGFPWYLQQAGYYTSNNAKTDYNVRDEKKFIQNTWNESSQRAGWWKRKEGQPFFAVFNFNDSHQSRTMTEPYARYEEQVLSKLSHEEIIRDTDFEVPPFYRDSPEMRKQLARVYNAVKLTDKKIGELLQRLKQDGLEDNTIVFVFADHGEGIPRGKTNGINLGYRVPLFARFPEKYKHLAPKADSNGICSELLSFEDLAPTMIHLAGGTIPEHLTGRIIASNRPGAPHLFLSSDRSDNGLDMVRTVTDGRFAYSRNYMPYMPEVRYIRYMEIGEIKQQMRADLDNGMLTPLQQSLFESRPAEFLYDIEKDPWEQVNLANNPEYSNTLKKFRKLLRQEILDSRDVMFLPEYELEEIAKTSTPYEFRTSVKDYPLNDILEAAELSGFKDLKTAKSQARLLKSDNRIVRYWAGMGLLNQPSDITRRFLPELKIALNDPYGPAASTVAAVVYRLTQDEQAENALNRYCLDTNPHLALMTINYLLYSPEKTRFVNSIRTVHGKMSSPYPVKAACMDFLGSLGLVPNNFEYRE